MEFPGLNRASEHGPILEESGLQLHSRSQRMRESIPRRLWDTNPRVRRLLLSRASSTQRKTCDPRPDYGTTFLDSALQSCRAATMNAAIRPHSITPVQSLM